MSEGQSGFARLSEFVRRYPLVAVIVVIVVGGAGAVIGAPVADEVDRYFSSDAFCANTCHIMTATVAKELHESDHWNGPSGVRATCGDCHVSETLLAAWWDHIIGLRELYAFTIGGIDTVEEFEEERAALANRTRLGMIANDSKNCRTCHVMAAIKPERTRGQKQHEEARKEGTTCIACHYNLVHKEVPLSDEVKKALGIEEEKGGARDFTL